MAQSKKTPSEKGKEEVKNREAVYAHPEEVFRACAIIWTGILESKLKAPVEAHEVGLMMVGHKIAREATLPNVEADNLVDIAGYADTVAMVYEREEASSKPAT